MLKSLKNYLTGRLLRVIDARMNTVGCRVQRGAIMSYAFEFAAKSGLDGNYLEFGCYDGASFIAAWKAYQRSLKNPVPGQRMTRRKMYAFDSFQGLPELTEEDEYGNYQVFEKGQYAFSEKEFLKRLEENGVDRDYVRTVPGFYDKTLTEKLKKEMKPDRAMIVHIDCDLYSSALCALEFVTDLIQDGTVLLFDDYFCYKAHPEKGVRGAFRKWLAESDRIATPYLNYSWAGMAFVMHEKSSLESPLLFEKSGGVALP